MMRDEVNSVSIQYCFLRFLAKIGNAPADLQRKNYSFYYHDMGVEIYKNDKN